MQTVVRLFVLLLAVLRGTAFDFEQSLSDLKRQRTTVSPELASHAALSQLDLEFCGSGSESQISRGPLGCGFPVVGDHPWLVALGFSTLDRHVQYLCSGALINDQHVVTSARCARGTINYRLSTVRVSEYDFRSRRDCLWSDPEVCLKAEEAAVAAVAVHPEFADSDGGEASRFDVALVKLAEPVTLRHGVRPICLPMFPLRQPPHRQWTLTLGLKGRQSAADGAATCCECGRDRSTTSHMMDEEKLSIFNRTFSGKEPCRYQLMAPRDGERPECLGSGTPCMADLGGPLVAADKFGSVYYLMGVASQRPAQGECQKPGVTVMYTSVKPHLRWILDSIEKLAGQTDNAGGIVTRFGSNTMTENTKANEIFAVPNGGSRSGVTFGVFALMFELLHIVYF